MARQLDPRLLRVPGGFAHTIALRVKPPRPSWAASRLTAFKNVGVTTAQVVDSSLPGGQDHYFKAISALAADGAFTSEKALEISKKFDTNFPTPPETSDRGHRRSAVSRTAASTAGAQTADLANFEKIGLFDSELRFAEDTDWFNRALEVGSDWNGWRRSPSLSGGTART